MDLRKVDKDTQLRETIDRALTGINTCVPGLIESFDEDAQTATVIPAIRMRVNLDGKTTHVDLPPIVNAPLVFPFAATVGFALTLPVSKGDPCLILFSQRALDNWAEFGGIQPPENNAIGARHHDLTDALILMAPAPAPVALGAWNGNGIELRNAARTSRVTVEDAQVVMVAGGVTMTLNSTGLHLSGGTLTGVGNIDLFTHRHVDPQGGDVGVPIS